MTAVLFQMIIEDVSGKNKKPRWICTNPDTIQLLYGKLIASPYNMQRKSVTRGIDELLAKGFIKVNEQGGSKKGHASIYGLTEDYLKWNPGDEPIRTRRPYVKRGFCAQKKEK